ncbi:MAG TPA: glycosyltransferase [Candidatus Scubalenecus merdavium]|uniref:Glycosyltransferase n=1 Tax=Candidatus Scybalenecus merdavium TaxID=2840939 RepID=A0A9D1MTJ4_9FIRM|nr:glycosyltransferase [Candidatus Scubalenecus merdavium]
MKKSILISCYGLGIGGIEKCLVNMVNSLDPSKYNVDILLMSEENALREQILRPVTFLPIYDYVYTTLESKKSVIRNGPVRYLVFRFLNKFGYFPWKTFKKIKKKYDIAIAYSQQDFSPFYIIDKVKADKKILWYHNGTYNKNKKAYSIDQKYYKKFDNIVAVSNACKSNLARKFPELQDKIIVLYNLIDANQIVKSSMQSVESGLFPSDKINLLTVARMSSEKGPDIAVDVCSQLINKGYNIVWYWVGDGNQKSNIIKKIKELKLEKSFYLLGDQLNPYKFIRKCDIYVQPSRYEAYCTTTNEAKILSKTIVTTRVGGMDEQIVNGQTGYLVEGTVDHLEKQIEELLKYPEKREYVENNLRKSKANLWNYNQKYDKYFASLLGENLAE